MPHGRLGVAYKNLSMKSDFSQICSMQSVSLRLIGSIGFLIMNATSVKRLLFVTGLSCIKSPLKIVSRDCMLKAIA